MDDSFLKLFRDLPRLGLDRYELDGSFRGWLKRVLIHTVIDYSRAQQKHQHAADPTDLLREPFDGPHTPPGQLAYDELLALVQQLPAAYRTVFNLFAIDGYPHEEIARQLGITTDTSKFNLFKTRAHLQRLLRKTDSHVYTPCGV